MRTISFILGVIGIILPILPTTPFLLLSSYCYIKSSNKLYDLLINNKIFGKYISNYIEYKSIDKKSKMISTLFLWLTIGISFFLMENLYIKILLLIVSISVSIHILKLKTI